MEPIVVDEVRTEEDSSRAVLSCRLRAMGLNLPSRISFQVPPELAPHLAKNGDPFLPVGLLLAMSCRRRLVIEADVSATLLSASGTIMDIYRSWSSLKPKTLDAVEVLASPIARDRRGTSSGAFFSGGVDSFYTLLKNVARYPAGDSRLVTHLLLVHGFDVKVTQEDLFQQVRQEIADVAEQLGKRLVIVKTDVKSALAGIHWGDYAHGPALASVGLALAGLFHTLYIPATYAFTELRPRGSHPGTDPLWSTEGLEFVHDGAEADRSQKIRMLARSPAALRSLRVCWENRGNAYNCGRCEKCLRTMVELEMCGVLSQARMFPTTIEATDVERLVLPAFLRGFWRGTLTRLRAAQTNDAVTRAIERALERGVWMDSRLGRLEARGFAALARTGMTSARIKSIDSKVFRGKGTAILRLFQRLYHRAGDA
jgi:hypothetical protein